MVKLNPGRELDALVAEKVMGKKVIQFVDEYLDVMHKRGGDFFGKEYVCTVLAHNNSFKMHLPGQTIKICPSYSTDIAAAWEVVEKLTSDESIKLEIQPSNFHKEYQVAVTFEDRDEDAMGPFYILEKTAPHAICLAALKAIGVDSL